MPDVWTSNPEHLRDGLIQLGAECGKEARVLKPRDSEWTCHIDGGGWLRDVYIHHYRDFYNSWLFRSPVLIALILGIFIGLLWGKRFWKKVENQALPQKL